MTLPQMQTLKNQMGGEMKSLEGMKVRILVDDYEIEGKITGTESKFPVISTSSGFKFKVSFNDAYRAVYMNQLIRM
mgnify:CR=1 FL=1